MIGLLFVLSIILVSMGFGLDFMAGKITSRLDRMRQRFLGTKFMLAGMTLQLFCNIVIGSIVWSILSGALILWGLWHYYREQKVIEWLESDLAN